MAQYPAKRIIGLFIFLLLLGAAACKVISRCAILASMTAAPTPSLALPK